MDFVKRNVFWIVVALVVVVAGVAFGALFVPERADNTRFEEEIRQRADSVATHRQSPRVVNEQWIQQAEQQADMWREEIERIRGQLQQEAGTIRQLFRDEGHPDDEPLEAGMWKMVYREKVRELTQLGEESFKVFNPDGLVVTEYGDEWPPDEEMRQQELKYWIQRHLVGALADLNIDKGRPVVAAFDEFQFFESPDRLLHPSHGDIFRPIPFRIRVATTFPNLPLVIHSLLTSEANCSITSVEVERSARAGPRRHMALAQRLEIEAAEAAPAERPQQVAQRRPRPPVDDLDETPAWVEEMMRRPDLQGPPPEVLRGMEQPERRDTRRDPRRAPQRQEPEPDVELPENLVEVTLRGYVLDYREQQDQQQ